MPPQRFLALLILPVLLAACGAPDKTAASKQEILDTEKAFEACVKNEGLAAGFTKYAAPGAVINRGDSLLRGRDAIRAAYDKRDARNVTLTWTADFVDVSASGDLGYTYGRYTHTVRDSTGAARESRGTFHTVWKRQPDNTWKYVWD